jgi:hypothetical protein
MRNILILLIILVFSLPVFAAPKGNTTYFGDSANVVLHIDLQRLQQGQTPKSLLGMLMMNPKAKEKINKFNTQFGLDPFKDIESLTAQVTLKAPQTDPLMLLHIKGKFNQAQFLKGLGEEGNVFAKETLNGKDLYVSAASKSALTFVQDGVLMGSPEELRTAVKGGSKYAGALYDQQAKLAQGGDLWFVAQFPEEMRQQMQLKNPAMMKAKALRGYLDFAQGLHISLISELMTATDASKAAEELTNSITQAKSTPQAAMFMSVMNKFSATAKGNELVIDVPLSQDEVNQIQAMVGMMLMALTANQGGAAAPAPKGAGFPSLKGPVVPATPVAPAAPASPVAPAVPTH